MKFRSGRNLGTSAPLRSASSPRREADRISALSDDLLVLILVRLGCATAAASTCLLSRRWRGLWTRLPALVFRDVALPSLEQALAFVISSASSDADAVSLLDILLPKQAIPARTGDGVSSLLRTVARLSPDQLILTLPRGTTLMYSSVELPCFTRATSISLTAASPITLRPSSDEFPALTTLVITGCVVYGLAALVLRCPRLSVLKFIGPEFPFNGDIMVHSASLRELVLDDINRMRRIDISTPMLEQLTVSTSPRRELHISILAPKVEKASWRSRYSGGSFGSGNWILDGMNLLSTPVAVAAAQRGRASVMLRVDVAKNRFVFFEDPLLDQDYMAREVEKHLQVAGDSSLSALELHLAPLGHVYEALVFFFLEMRLIRTAIRSLQVTLLQPETTHTDKRECSEYCGCIPRPWTRQTIILPELLEVEIHNFQGADHEFDFLDHIFACAPMLKRVTLKRFGVAAPTNTKHHDFFKAHPCVECYHVLSSDSQSWLLRSEQA